MSSEWKEFKLKDVADIVGGGTPSTLNSDYWNGDVSWITPKDLSTHQGIYISSGERSITDLALTSSSTKILKKNAVLFSSRAPIGYVAIAASPLCTNQGFKSLELKNGFDSLFFYYLLKWHKPKIEAISTGSTFKEISGTALGNYTVTVPNLETQRKISSVLYSIDNCIQVLLENNNTISAIAKTLFKSWFINFDPILSIQEGRKQEGVSKDISEFYNVNFQSSALGEIPAGWEVRSLDSIAQYLNGLALQKYPPNEESTFPVIKIAQLRKGDSSGADQCNTTLPPQYVVEDGDVLFSWSGSLEVEIWCGGIGALNQHLFKVTSEEFPKWYYYYWTLHHLDEFRLIAASKATTMGHIQRGHLRDAKVLLPPKQLLNAMTQVMSPLIDQLIANKIQLRNLVSLRDSMLPKLLGGELSVENVKL
jgi:type I restriction enzyme S subunit